MTDSAAPAPSRRKKTDILAFARWTSNLHCLWRYCEKRGCQRGRACRGDPAHCLHFMPLVPYEAREFILGWDEAQAAGLSFAEMIDANPQAWDTLMRWRGMVRDTLRENRRAQRRDARARAG